MNTESAPALNALVFVIEPEAEAREAICAAIAEIGCTAFPFASLDAAINLLAHGATCNFAVLSTNVLDDNPDRFDQFLAAHRPPPAVIVCGVDPAAKLALHCLNRGARDFLAKPIEKEQLIRALKEALVRDLPHPPSGKTSVIVASSPITDWIELTASSELEYFRRVQRFSDALFASRLPDQVREDLKMAVEEVGRNAVEWGNHFDPGKRLHVSYCVFHDRVVIKVEDEGEGFVPQNVPDPTADPLKAMQARQTAGKRPGGYGVFLLQQLVDEIVYNEKGNSVLLTKYLPADSSADDAPDGKT